MKGYGGVGIDIHVPTALSPEKEPLVPIEWEPVWAPDHVWALDIYAGRPANNHQLSYPGPRQ
jgi:hypothetical protein